MQYDTNTHQIWTNMRSLNYAFTIYNIYEQYTTASAQMQSAVFKRYPLVELLLLSLHNEIDINYQFYQFQRHINYARRQLFTFT